MLVLTIFLFFVTDLLCMENQLIEAVYPAESICWVQFMKERKKTFDTRYTKEPIVPIAQALQTQNKEYPLIYLPKDSFEVLKQGCVWAEKNKGTEKNPYQLIVNEYSYKGLQGLHNLCTQSDALEKMNADQLQKMYFLGNYLCAKQEIINQIIKQFSVKTQAILHHYVGAQEFPITSKKLTGHTSYVSSAAFSPDGNYIVSASGDKTIRIWDVATGKQLHCLDGHTEWVNSAAFSLDGKYIVSVSDDGTIRIWDVATGKQLHCLDGHTDCVNSTAFSPDGTQIVSASEDKTIRIWDMATGKQLDCLDGHTNWVNSAAFSPDGTQIVSASEDKTVRIWDVFTGKQLHCLDGHTNWVRSAAFSLDGKYIVSASFDKTMRIWDVFTGKQLHCLDGHTNWVRSAAFSLDGKYIVSASEDKTIRIWDMATGKQLYCLRGHTDCVKSAAFSPDGTQIVSASEDETVRIWDVFTGKQLHCLDEHIDCVNSAVFSPDDKYIVSASTDKTVCIWNLYKWHVIDESKQSMTIEKISGKVIDLVNNIIAAHKAGFPYWRPESDFTEAIIFLPKAIQERLLNKQNELKGRSIFYL